MQLLPSTSAPAMAETARPWPEYVHQSFTMATMMDVQGHEGHDKTVFYGPFMRLLYTLFSLDGPYEIALFKGPYDSDPVLIVHINHRPVFFMEIQPHSSLLQDSYRVAADEQMRQRFTSLGRRTSTTIPTLHGVSAFGNHLSFYEYDAATSDVQPKRAPQDLSSAITDVVPMSRWDCDVMKPEGASRLKDVVEKVKEMSKKMPGYVSGSGRGQVCNLLAIL